MNLDARIFLSCIAKMVIKLYKFRCWKLQPFMKIIRIFSFFFFFLRNEPIENICCQDNKFAFWAEMLVFSRCSKACFSLSKCTMWDLFRSRSNYILSAMNMMVFVPQGEKCVLFLSLITSVAISVLKNHLPKCICSTQMYL